jgi:hypothetical protein
MYSILGPVNCIDWIKLEVWHAVRLRSRCRKIKWPYGSSRLINYIFQGPCEEPANIIARRSNISIGHGVRENGPISTGLGTERQQNQLATLRKIMKKTFNSTEIVKFLHLQHRLLVSVTYLNLVVS